MDDALAGLDPGDWLASEDRVDRPLEGFELGVSTDIGVLGHRHERSADRVVDVTTHRRLHPKLRELAVERAHQTAGMLPATLEVKELRILGYVRVSTAEQEESGLGLEAQEAQLRGECERRGWKLVELIADPGHSGKTLDRPGVQRALTMLAQHRADGLVIAKLDRLTRSVLEFCLLVEWFDEVGATLVALDLAIDTSTPAGRLMANVLAAFAEWERDMIAARTRAGLAALRARGKPIGRPSVADQPELERWIRQMREEEGKTLQEIADTLNAEGVPTLRGAPEWRPSSVQSAAGYRRPRPRRRAAALPEPRRR